MITLQQALAKVAQHIDARFAKDIAESKEAMLRAGLPPERVADSVAFDLEVQREWRGHDLALVESELERFHAETGGSQS